jgi:outer membrane protein
LSAKRRETFRTGGWPAWLARYTLKEIRMKNRHLTLFATSAAVALGLFAAQARAADLAPVEAAPEAAVTNLEQSPWLVRLRGVYVLTNNKGHVNGVDKSDLSYSNTTIPELDISYFFNEHIATELILGTTWSNVNGKGSIAGLGQIGKVWLLPPTLTAQYHFTDFGNFQPYIGAGINYTMFYSQDAKSADKLDVKDTFGVALQAGFDYKIDEHWSFNADVKKIFLQPKFDVTVGGTDLNGKAKIDPWLIGTGIGYRF